MIHKDIHDWLFAHQDVAYAAFTAKLVPTVKPETIIGVRVPEMRAFAKELIKRNDLASFLSALPHHYFEEKQLHVLILSIWKDYQSVIQEIDAFLPFVDNWATCDMLSPKIFKKHQPDLPGHIERWLASEHVYTVRFGIGMLMQFYLDQAFEIRYAEMVAAVKSDAYYVNMMIAWYFATALAKQYDASLPYLLENRLDAWTHNKTIQKAVESRRITPEQKNYLKTLKRKA